MTEGYEEDLNMYEEASGRISKQLDCQVLMEPIEDLEYPTDPASVSPDTPVGEAVRLMSDRRIGSLLVLEKGKVVGIFGERDVLLKNIWDGRSLEAPVSEFMTHDPVCLTTHDSIALAISRMVVGGYRHIPLVTATGEPSGILTMRDVMGYIASFFPEETINVPPHSEHNPPERNVEGG